MCKLISEIFVGIFLYRTISRKENLLFVLKSTTFSTLELAIVEFIIHNKIGQVAPSWNISKKKIKVIGFTCFINQSEPRNLKFHSYK